MTKRSVARLSISRFSSFYDRIVDDLDYVMSSSFSSDLAAFDRGARGAVVDYAGSDIYSMLMGS